MSDVRHISSNKATFALNKYVSEDKNVPLD